MPLRTLRLCVEYPLCISYRIYVPYLVKINIFNPIP